MSSHTQRQLKFAEAYVKSGNAMAAAIQAGYSEQYARHRAHENLMRNPVVLARIKELNEKTETDTIGNLIDLRTMWTRTMRDETEEMKIRLKASELLGKSLGGFIGKVDNSGEMVIRVVRNEPTD